MDCIAASSLVVIITTLLQSTTIKHVNAERATIIYTLEPLTATVLAFFLIGEKLSGITAVAGCVIILLAVVLSTVKMGKKKIIASDVRKNVPMISAVVD